MKCRICNGTGTAVYFTADGEKEPEPCLCTVEEDYFSFLDRHGIPVAEEEYSMKGHIRFQNGILAVSEIQAISWKRLTKDDPLMVMWEKQGHMDSSNVFSLIVFLKGGNKFMTTTTRKNLDKIIGRFKNWNDGENYEYEEERMVDSFINE